MISRKLILEFKKYCDAYGWSFDNDSSEFTFQFRLGWFINEHFPNKYVIDFETNIKKLATSDIHKKEIDIHVLNKTDQSKHAIELKFVKDKSGYDITLFEMCKDIKFLEKLVTLHNFKTSYSIAFSSVAKAYTAPKNGKFRSTGPRLSFHKCFRENHCITGNIYRNDQQQYDFTKEYKLDWFDFSDNIKACIVKVE